MALKFTFVLSGRSGPSCVDDSDRSKRVLLTVETPRLTGPALRTLESEWRDLEGRAAGSFFQSWSWVGCRVAERFDTPVLVRAVTGGNTVGLALFNRRALPFAPRSLWLHETGRAAEDSVFIESNGPLVALGHEEAARAMLRTALREGGGAIVLSGIEDGVVAATTGLGWRRVNARREAPYAVLAGATEPRDARFGASTRSQLRRSRRRLEELGPLSARRADSLAEALAFLEGLAGLHQKVWVHRGQPGAFAEPAFQRFHAALIARSFARQEVSLWRVSAGTRVTGYLYNLHWRGRVVCYQSGFDLDAAPRASPGLVAHSFAIAAAAAEGAHCYDFLAGDMRYKRELGDASRAMHWIELTSHPHPRTILDGVRHLARICATPFRSTRAGCDGFGQSTIAASPVR